MINLLPLDYKEALQQEERVRLVLILATLIFLFLISLSLMLLAVRIYLAGQIEIQKSVSESQQEQFAEYTSTKNAIENINAGVANVDALYQNQIAVSQVLLQISSALPEGFYISTFNYDLESAAAASRAQIALAGFAPTRNSLSDFARLLKENPMFAEVDLPPSFLGSDRNIEFSLTAELDLSPISEKEEL